MKATGKTTNSMGSVEALGVTGKNMKGSTKKGRNTEMAPWHGKKGHSIQVSSAMIWCMGWGNIQPTDS